MDNKEVKCKWTEALRSGEYKQGAGKLKMCHFGVEYGDPVQTHCCLGVLTELYIKEMAENGVEVKWGDVVPPAETYLSRRVANWAGFSPMELDDRGHDGVDVYICPNCGDVDHDDYDPSEKLNHQRASAINDNYANEGAKHGSFEDIADAIERYL